MDILYIHRANFDKRPPVISCVINLLRLGHKVTVITTGITDDLYKKIIDLGGTVEIAEYKLHTNKFELFIRSIKYRYTLKNILKKHNPQKTILWIEGNYTFSVLIGLFKKYRYVLQIQELHKNQFQYFIIKHIIKKASIVFMPEYNRSYYYKCLYHLNSLPVVLPNKPYFIPSHIEINNIKKKYQNTIDIITKKKTILYQGIISSERDLAPFIKACNKLGNDYHFVILGKDYGVLEKYKKIDHKIIHIPYLSAPDYLAITSLAYLGIVTYVPDCLNTVYCAPNKIYEYSSFGIPIIGNDIPGLRYPIKEYGLGEIVNEFDENNILNAITKITSNYNKYSEASLSFYNSVNSTLIIKEAINNSNLESDFKS